MLNYKNTDCEYDKVFCDWLDITFSSLENSAEDFVSFFLDAGFSLTPSSKNFSSSGFSLTCIVDRDLGGRSNGTIKIDTLERVGIIRVSVSGVSLEFLREENWFNEMLGFFSERPYHITRLDSAIDKNVVGYKRLSVLRSKFSTECALSKRALRTKWFLSKGLEGHPTGTFYIGHRSKASATARCYDKRHQIWETTGVDVGFNVFRYEVTTKFKRDRLSATLGDVSDPSSLFYYYASPSLMRKPSDISEWVGSSDFSFEAVLSSGTLPADRLKFLVQDNYLFQRLAEISLETGGGGVSYALSVLRDELEKHSNSL